MELLFVFISLHVSGLLWPWKWDSGLRVQQTGTYLRRTSKRLSTAIFQGKWKQKGGLPPLAFSDYSHSWASLLNWRGWISFTGAWPQEKKTRCSYHKQKSEKYFSSRHITPCSAMFVCVPSLSLMILSCDENYIPGHSSQLLSEMQNHSFHANVFPILKI